MRLLTIAAVALAAAPLLAQQPVRHSTVYPTTVSRPPIFPNAPWNRCTDGVCTPTPAVAVQLDYQYLVDLLAADERFRGPQGAEGKAGADGVGQIGPPGLNGLDGSPGSAPTIDYSALREMLANDNRFQGEAIDYAHLVDLMAADARFQPAQPSPLIIPPGPIYAEPPFDPPSFDPTTPLPIETEPPAMPPETAALESPAPQPGFDWFGVAMVVGAAALGAAGVGVPWWLGVAAKGARVVHHRRDRRAARDVENGGDGSDDENGGPAAEPRYRRQRHHERGPEPITVEIESPPPPQERTTDTRYVPFENDTFGQAHAWAREQTARKYPGAVPHLEVLQDLINQKLAAMRAASNSME